MDSIKDLFDKIKKPFGQPKTADSVNPVKKTPENQAALAEMALKAIHDGVVMTDKNGVIQFINPAAVTMTEVGSPDQAIGLDYGLVVKLESKEGRELTEADNPLIQAMKSNRPLERAELILIPTKSSKRIPVAISMLPAEGFSGNRIITFRNITAELEEEGEQTEFISTASHEMRTPVATIDGYLTLALNPQTATIDERARGYLTAAEKASKHLGKLFQDLLDVTKLDDGKIHAKLEPVEMTELIKTIANDYIPRAQAAKISFTFGSAESAGFDSSRRLDQVVYGYVDVNFMREIMDNLIENALKYTPSGGSVYVNVRGDGDRVLINVTDTGIGISADDLTHIFQKFYRADNSDTREIGGTGLGLYLVKQRVEAMNGRVWAESGFGEGSTFFVSLPRISGEEYEKRMIAVNNRAMQPQPVVAPVPQPTPTPQTAPAQQPIATPQPAPASQPTPAPKPQPTPVSAPQPVVPAPVQPVVQPVATTPTSQPTPAPISQPAPTPQATMSIPQSVPAPQPTPATRGTPEGKALVSPPPVSPIPSTPTINNNLNGEAK